MTRQSKGFKWLRRIMSKVPSNFLKSVCAQNFLSATRGVLPRLRQWSISSLFSENLLDCHEKFRKLHFSVWLFPQNVFSSAKISDDLFSVMDSQNFSISHHILHFYSFPKYVNFPLKTSPNLSCSKNFFSSKMQNKLFPPTMKISASFPHGMDAPRSATLY